MFLQWEISNKLIFFDLSEATAKKSRIQIRNPVYGSWNPDPCQNVTDPKHWFVAFLFSRVSQLKPVEQAVILPALPVLGNIDYQAEFSSLVRKSSVPGD